MIWWVAASSFAVSALFAAAKGRMLSIELRDGISDEPEMIRTCWYIAFIFGAATGYCAGLAAM